MIIASLAAIFASCDKDSSTKTEPQLVQIRPVITKATETNFEAGDKIGVTIVKGSETVASNAEFSYDGSSFKGSLNWYDDEDAESTLYAYYPLAASVPTEFTVAADQSAGATSSDLIASVKTGVKPMAEPVTMNFTHRLSRINITVKNVSGSDIKDIVIKNAVLSADVDRDFNATVKSGAQAGEIKACKITDDSYYIILPPQTATLTASVTTDKTLEQALAQATFTAGVANKLSIVVKKDDIQIVLSGEIDGWQDGGDIEEPQDPNTVKWGGEVYKTVTLKDGRTWLAEPLRYIPQGKTPSSDPADENGIWNPYNVVDGVVAPSTDEAVIKAQGYLYDYSTALGAEVTADNFSSFEGAQGICPTGWHIPTRAEFVALVGVSTKAEGESGNLVDASAAYYDQSYNGAKIAALDADGFGWSFAGALNRTSISGTGSYMKNAVAAGKGIDEYLGKNGLTYVMGSTGYKYTEKDGALSNIQFFGLMSTFTATYTEGRVSVAYTNFKSGFEVRCIKNN